MNFMNAPDRTFEAAAQDARFSQLYIKPYSIAAMRSDLPHAGDEYLLSLLRLSVEGERWACDAFERISALMSNKCGCDATGESTSCKCDGTCAPLVHRVQRLRDLIRGHCYFQNKGAVIRLTNAVYTRGMDSGFGIEEDGAYMQTMLSERKATWVTRS